MRWSIGEFVAQKACERGKRITILSALFLMCLAGFLTRLLPLSISQYPYNNDSLVECGMTVEIAESGHLRFSPNSPWAGTHSAATPLMNVVFAFTTESLGTDIWHISQLLIAVFFLLTVSSLFLLAREMIGSSAGAIGACLSALAFGTFVFTTGSVWKESMGIALLPFLLYCYIMRRRPSYRILFLVTMATLPAVHHLVALIAYLMLSFLLMWSWTFAVMNSSLSRRIYLDTAMILPLTVAALVYYLVTVADRGEIFASPLEPMLFLTSFLCVSLLAFMVLLMRYNAKRTFAPIVGGALLTVLLLDYSGYIYPYVPSASQTYIVLIASSSVVIGVAWYGAEQFLMIRPVYKAVLVGMLISPLIMMLFGLGLGINSISLQIFYRVFDFADFFLFLGIGYSIHSFRIKSESRAFLITLVVIASLIATFPFGYYTSGTLGVRHDTAAYEVDAIEWFGWHMDSPRIVSDERLGRIAFSILWVEKRPGLPGMLQNGDPLSGGDVYLMEDSWTTVGVNNYPYGRVVVARSLYESILHEYNVVYIGGPISDRIFGFAPPMI